MSQGAILLTIYVGGALSVSFVCSLLEAILLSSRLGELEARRADGNRGVELLLHFKRERLDDAISAVLTLNTVAHTVGSALAGAQAAHLFGDIGVGIFSGLLTLAVLVGTEIIPKTLGTVYASQLASFVGYAVAAMVRLLSPLLILTRAITRAIAPSGQTPVSRSEVLALVSLAAREGTLRVDESRVLGNLLGLEQIRVEDVMTPRTVVTMLPEQATIDELLAQDEATAYSRIPLFSDSRDHITGYVLQREVLLACARGAASTLPLSEFRREIGFLPARSTLAVALRRFLDQREHVAMAVDEYGGIAGLVTLEDLVETVLGVEIRDESDRVDDLRQVAGALRDQRLARLREARARTMQKATSPRG